MRFPKQSEEVEQKVKQKVFETSHALEREREKREKRERESAV